MKKLLLIFLTLAASPCFSQTQIVYVDASRPDYNGDGTSWVTAKKNLWQVLWEASAGQQIWVKTGTYKPTTDFNVNMSFVLRNGVEIYGGFNGTETLLSQTDEKYNVTILSGDLEDNEGPGFLPVGITSFRILSSENVNSTAVLDGFTIKGGGGGANLVGAGMFNTSSASPIIRNTIFVGNNTASVGGAVFNGGGKPTFINCVFYKNTARNGSGIYNTAASPTIINCIFTENTSTDGGVICTEGQSGSNSTTTIINSTITSNHATSGVAGVVASKTEVIIHNDLDGTYTYSRMLSLRPDGKGITNLYPNPVTDRLTLSLLRIMTSQTAADDGSV